jgi:hypothetical protein
MAMREISPSSNSQRIQSEPFEFETKGDSLEGVLVEKATLKSRATGKDFRKYTIRTSDGAHSSTLGSYQLDQALNEVEEGTLVRITYGGKKKLDGGKTVKLFKVEADDGQS